MKLKNTKERVKDLMERIPRLRDNDFRLQAVIWRKDLIHKGWDLNKMTAFELLQLYSQGNLTNAESIRRSRADIEKDFPELRGETYEERQGKRQDETREELGFPKRNNY